MKHLYLFENWVQNKIDEILDKMNRKEVLSQEEKDFLDNPHKEIIKPIVLPNPESEPNLDNKDILRITCKISKLKNYEIFFDFHYKEADSVEDTDFLLYGDLTILGIIYYGFIQVDNHSRYTRYSFEDLSSDDEYEGNGSEDANDYIDFDTMVENDSNLSNYLELFFVEVARELKNQ